MTDTLRVTSWKDFVGQDKLKERLDVHIKAARLNQRLLEHVLLVGPPGFGKTSLGVIIAKRLDKNLLEHTMPLDLRMMITICRTFRGVLLLDEIHRGSTKEQESLLPLLEFGYIQDRRGNKYIANDSESIGITIIGATTEPEKLIPPLYDRFSIRPDFDDYTPEEMGRIVINMAQKAGVRLEPLTAESLGRATGGIPRRARQFVLAARDLEALGKPNFAADILALCRIDEDGLSFQHHQYLLALDRAGGVSGLKPLQNLLRLNETVVRELERLLLKHQYIMYASTGRELTGDGYKKIKTLKP